MKFKITKERKPEYIYFGVIIACVLIWIILEPRNLIMKFSMIVFFLIWFLIDEFFYQRKRSKKPNG